MCALFTGIEYVETSNPPKVRFHFQFTNTSGNLANSYGYKAELRLFTGNKDTSNMSEGIYLGELLDPHQQFLRLRPKDTRDIYLDFTLFPYTKNVIGKYRDGDLIFKILLRYYHEPLDEQGKRQSINSAWKHVLQRHSQDIRIPNSEWSSILTKAGYDSFQIIELPINFNKIRDETRSLEEKNFQLRLKKASDHLVNIMVLMDEGNWSEAVGECRICLEALTRGDGVRKEINIVLESSGFPEKNIVSFRNLLQQLVTFTSLKHHAVIDDEEKELVVPMGREDALFAVSTLTTIINLLSRKYLKQRSIIQ